MVICPRCMKLPGPCFGSCECNFPLAWMNDGDWLQESYIYMLIMYKVQ